MLLSCRQMQEAEERAFDRGVSAADLMEQAGRGMFAAIRQFFPEPGTAVLYLGKGNNGGDALVAARFLHETGWRIRARLSAPADQLKPLPLGHFKTLEGIIEIAESPLTAADLPAGRVLLLDGLLGIGARGPLSPALAALAAEMNRLRRDGHARVAAIDLPSGLDGDTGIPQPDCVQADVTLTVAQVKTGLVADAAINHVGRLVLIPLPELAANSEDTATLLEPRVLRPLLPRRPFETHKNQAGRLLIVAGSPGYLGAAELACRGALQAGAGMVTLAVNAAVYPLLAARVPPEVMVRPVQSYGEALELSHDAAVIGPGLGRSADAEIHGLAAGLAAPFVLDADALNALAPLADGFAPPAPGVITPHPGEWRRLVPELATGTLDRRQQAETLAQRTPGLTVLLKGARTVVATRGEPTFLNSTGHPGMATGGMGDLLSGVLGALLAQGVPPHAAAGLAAWLCGRAAERAAQDSHELAVLPSSAAAQLGRALADLVELRF